MGLLRATHDEIICSLIRYALSLVGTRFRLDLLAKMYGRILNIAARKTSVLGPSTRIASAHYLAGTWTYPNYYTQQCANLMDSCLGAANRAIQGLQRRELCHFCALDALETIGEIRESKLASTAP